MTRENELPKGPTGHWEAMQWHDHFRAMGYPFHPRMGVHVDMDAVDDRRRSLGLTDSALAEMSKQLKAEGQVLYGLSQKTVQNARRGQPVQFGRAFTLAHVLGFRVRDILVLDRLSDAGGEEETAPVRDRPSEAPAPGDGTDYAPGSVLPEMRMWTRLVVLTMAGGVALYALMLVTLGFELLYPLYTPLFAAIVAGVGYRIRARGRYPIPPSLRIAIGVALGLVLGTASFVLITNLDPPTLLYFDAPVMQFAGVAFVTTTMLAFLAGYRVALWRRTGRRGPARTRAATLLVATAVGAVVTVGLSYLEVSASDSQRANAVSSEERASTQAAPSEETSFFQKGALDLR